jgi:hypothetical protein
MAWQDTINDRAGIDVEAICLFSRRERVTEDEIDVRRPRLLGEPPGAVEAVPAGATPPIQVITAL